jgi:dipeptide/tripeptide permease
VELCERFSYYGTTAVCTSHRFQQGITRLIQNSRQLHSAPSACWIYHWCPGPRVRF